MNWAIPEVENEFRKRMLSHRNVCIATQMWLVIRRSGAGARAAERKVRYDESCWTVASSSAVRLNVVAVGAEESMLLREDQGLMRP